MLPRPSDGPEDLPNSKMGGFMKGYGRVPPTSGWNRNILVDCAGDACPCRQGEPVHPGLLLTFSPGDGEYLRAEGICTARWGSSQQGRAAGQICGKEAERQAGDLWVCDYHLTRLREWFREDQPRIDRAVAIENLNAIQAEVQRRQTQDQAERMRIRREEAALERELEKERIRAQTAALAESSLIYYLRREDGSIKIGTSRAVPARAATLAREYGPLRLMATHGGGHKEEHALHEQFGDLRITPRGEWFRPGADLLKHIRALRREYEPTAAKNLPVVSMAEIGREIYQLSRGRPLESADPAA